jgi:hypothetical protein
MPIESRSRQRPDNPPPGGKAGANSDFDCDRISLPERIEYAPAKYATGSLIRCLMQTSSIIGRLEGLEGQSCVAPRRRRLLFDLSSHPSNRMSAGS